MDALAKSVEGYFQDSSMTDGTVPKAVFIVGPVCVGKTTHRKENCGDGHVLLDAGDIFLNLNGGSRSGFGELLQSELKMACYGVVGRAIMQRRNMVTELTLDTEESTAAFNAITKALADEPYELSVIDLDCDPETAKKRNETRDASDISSYYTTGHHLAAFAEVLKAKRSGILESGTCDVCGIDVKYPEGHMLTTRQVVGTPAYWEQVYEQNRQELAQGGIASFAALKANEPVRNKLAGRFAGEATPWMICKGCIAMFPANADEAQDYAKQWWERVALYELPGQGAVPLSDVNMGEEVQDTVPTGASKEEAPEKKKKWWGFRK